MECFLYHPDKGIITWRERPKHHFKSESYMKRANSRSSGKQAGTITTSNGKSYLVVRFKDMYMHVHRIAATIAYGDIPDGVEVDHINGDGLDNRIENLRLVTRSENMKNMRKRSDNKSGVTGVSKGRRNKWRSRIRVNNTEISLGEFSTVDEAAKARARAEIKYGFHENHGSERDL